MAPPPSLAWLKNLTGYQLRSLAAALGTTSSSPKPVLVSQIQSQLQHGLLAANHEPRSPLAGADGRPPGHDIISIDMGIRNLAFCHITLPATWSTNPQSSGGHADQIPLVKRWARFAVASLESDALVQSTHNTSGGDLFSADQGTENATNVQDAITPPKSNAYDPKTLSAQAYLLVCRMLGLHSSKTGSQNLHEPALPLLNLLPSTHILIERQRYRSMGGSAVQEWTLRVNTLEAMLYAVLQTLQETDLWHGNVHAVQPSQVAKYWLAKDALDTLVDDDGGGGEVTLPSPSSSSSYSPLSGKRKGVVKDKKRIKRENKEKVATETATLTARTKTAKIRLVEQWLESAGLPITGDVDGTGSLASSTPNANAGRQNGPVFAMEGQALQTATEYLRRRRGVGRKRRTTRQSADDTTAGGAVAQGEASSPPLLGIELGKLDDLADCLIQGMAWVKWEEKRRQVLREGEAGL